MTLDSTLAALSSEIIGQIVENLALHLKISATQLTLGVLSGSVVIQVSISGGAVSGDQLAALEHSLAHDSIGSQVIALEAALASAQAALAIPKPTLAELLDAQGTLAAAAEAAGVAGVAAW